jgi:hypothetical protein
LQSNLQVDPHICSPDQPANQSSETTGSICKTSTARRRHLDHWQLSLIAVTQARKDMDIEQTYWTLNFQYNDEISFTQATLDARYRQAGLQDLLAANGPYHRYKVVDFPGNERSGQYARIGVRKDGFHGQAPLYYVYCKDVINRQLRVPSPTTFRPFLIDATPAEEKPVFHTQVEGERGNIFFILGIICKEWQERSRNDLAQELIRRIQGVAHMAIGLEIARLYVQDGPPVNYDQETRLFMHLYGEKLYRSG